MTNTELLEEIVKRLVDKPEDVKISYKLADKKHKFGIKTNPQDTGKVIGKKGKTLESLRTLFNAMTVKNDGQYSIVHVIED